MGALSDMRVLDLGIITAGAATSALLGDFGADVIKVESTSYTDPFRAWTQVATSLDASAGLNNSPPFKTVNRNKRGIAIDLKTEQGRSTFLELVAKADLVVENFRRGVLARLGIDFPDLVAANPKIVLLSLSSQGNDGPESGFISFGSPLEAIGGLMAVTGYEPGAPLWSGNNVNYPDQLVSILAPGLALAGLRERDRTGGAVHVDAAQREAVTSAIGEHILQYTRDGSVRAPMGNRSPDFAPQGVYPAAGDDQWIAISVMTDQQWHQLLDVLAIEGEDVALLDSDERWKRHDEVDRLIGQATQAWDKSELANALQASGVPASPVLEPGEVLDHAQLAARGFHQAVDDDPILQRGFVAQLARTPASVGRAAPRIGQHTREVLTSVLGYDEVQIDALARDGAIFCEEVPVLVGGTTGAAR